MKTLTITDAKKNLGRWLAAVAQGEDIAIIRGGDVIALRKVDVESTIMPSASTVSPPSKWRLLPRPRNNGIAGTSGAKNS